MPPSSHLLLAASLVGAARSIGLGADDTVGGGYWCFNKDTLEIQEVSWYEWCAHGFMDCKKAGETCEALKEKVLRVRHKIKNFKECLKKKGWEDEVKKHAKETNQRHSDALNAIREASEDLKKDDATVDALVTDKCASLVGEDVNFKGGTGKDNPTAGGDKPKGFFGKLQNCLGRLVPGR
mmetsp:Transcript_42286/g.119554  ORF Transcript_42286/g.119554 Transcript_42286/m.119554 type:complete len:180 (+) Transcript_42286:48-587(+)